MSNVWNSTTSRSRAYNFVWHWPVYEWAMLLERSNSLEYIPRDWILSNFVRVRVILLGVRDFRQADLSVMNRRHPKKVELVRPIRLLGKNSSCQSRVCRGNVFVLIHSSYQFTHREKPENCNISSLLDPTTVWRISRSITFVWAGVPVYIFQV